MTVIEFRVTDVEESGGAPRLVLAANKQDMDNPLNPLFASLASERERFRRDNAEYRRFAQARDSLAEGKKALAEAHAAEKKALHDALKALVQGDDPSDAEGRQAAAQEAVRRFGQRVLALEPLVSGRQTKAEQAWILHREAWLVQERKARHAEAEAALDGVTLKGAEVLAALAAVRRLVWLNSRDGMASLRMPLLVAERVPPKDDGDAEE